MMILIASAAQKLRLNWAVALKYSFPAHEVSSRTALENYLSKRETSIVLVHTALPELNGLRGISDLLRLNPAARIVLFTRLPDNKEAVLALKLGVRGYCGEDLAPSLLVKAVRAVERGEIWISRSVIPDLLAEMAAPAQVREKQAAPHAPCSLDGLSARKLQIALLVGNGLCNKEISDRLSITESTVKAHLSAIFQSLGMTNRLRLALTVAEHH